MNDRHDQLAWGRTVSRRERFNGTEWLLLGVSVLAFTTAMVLFVRVVS